jgi:ABC-type branched-subunit amino acid transport system permease subunit
MRRLSLLQPGFIVCLLFFGLLAIFPLIIRESYILHVGILCMMYSCYTSSWNLVSGFAGIFGLGFQALAGVGGYPTLLRIYSISNAEQIYVRLNTLEIVH